MKKICIIIAFICVYMSCSSEKEISVPLLGTTWKLVGFVDLEANTTKLAPPNSGHCYTITFHQDNTLRGNSSANLLFGNYEITSEDGILTIVVHAGTEVMESPDGFLYIECLNEVNSYTLSNDRLSLYYSPNYYLLFKPYEL